MDYAKVDSNLASALDKVSSPDARKFPVFIKTVNAPTLEQADFLRRCGVGGSIEGRKLLTATVSPRMIDELTNQGWIRYLSLASTLRAY